MSLETFTGDTAILALLLVIAGLLLLIFVVLLGLAVRGFGRSTQNRADKYAELDSDLEEHEYQQVLDWVNKKAMNQSRNGAMCWYEGYAYFGLHRWDKAKAAFEQCVQLDTDYHKDLDAYIACLTMVTNRKY